MSSTIVCTARGDDGAVVLLDTAASDGLSPFLTASHPSFPRNLIDGVRCETLSELSLVASASFSAALAISGLLDLSASLVASALLASVGASAVASASVSISYKRAPTSTVSSLQTCGEASQNNMSTYTAP